MMPNVIPERSIGSNGSTPSESLRRLCLCLSADARGPQEELLRALKQGVDWVGLAAVANGYLMAPALWVALDRNGLLPHVPDDFGDYLAAIYRANAIRADTMRGQARRAVAALNAGGIEPLLLKGGVRLFEGTPEAGYARMMADLDLLVEERQFDPALGVLGRLGYEVVDAPSRRPSHATTLGRSGEPVAIDLHRDIGPQRDFIPLADAIANAVPVTAEACRLRSLSPTHRVMHVFFHAQIHDRGQAGGAIPLRHLEEFAWIAARHRPAIDWGAIARAADRQRLRGAWDAWLYLAERCLGMAAPLPLRQPRRARLHYRRCLWQIDHRGLDAVLRSALAVTEPLSYANIVYRYRCGASLGGLFRARAVETARLFAKYGRHIPQRLAAAIRDAHGQAS